MAEEQSSTDEIRDSSTSWTLASDDMLLRHMTAFGERLSKRADEVQAKLSALRDDTKRAEDTLGLLTNEFLYLANEQFIENRVYEDSDPEYAGAISEDGGMDGAGGDFAKSKEEEEAEFAAKAGVALRAGQQFLVDNFVKVKHDAPSDSSEDDDGEILEQIWEAKNPYHLRLPHIIGTVPFLSEQHLGLSYLDDDEVKKDSADRDDFSTDQSDDGEEEVREKAVASETATADEKRSQFSVVEDEEDVADDAAQARLEQKMFPFNPEKDADRDRKVAGGKSIFDDSDDSSEGDGLFGRKPPAMRSPPLLPPQAMSEDLNRSDSEVENEDEGTSEKKEEDSEKREKDRIIKPKTVKHVPLSFAEELSRKIGAALPKRNEDGAVADEKANTANDHAVGNLKDQPSGKAESDAIVKEVTPPPQGAASASDQSSVSQVNEKSASRKKTPGGGGGSPLSDDRESSEEKIFVQSKKARSPMAATTKSKDANAKAGGQTTLVRSQKKGSGLFGSDSDSNDDLFEPVPKKSETKRMEFDKSEPNYQIDAPDHISAAPAPYLGGVTNGAGQKSLRSSKERSPKSLFESSSEDEDADLFRPKGTSPKSHSPMLSKAQSPMPISAQSTTPHKAQTPISRKVKSPKPFKAQSPSPSKANSLAPKAQTPIPPKVQSKVPPKAQSPKTTKAPSPRPPKDQSPKSSKDQSPKPPKAQSLNSPKAESPVPPKAKSSRPTKDLSPKSPKAQSPIPPKAQFSKPPKAQSAEPPNSQSPMPGLGPVKELSPKPSKAQSPMRNVSQADIEKMPSKETGEKGIENDAMVINNGLVSSPSTSSTVRTRPSPVKDVLPFSGAKTSTSDKKKRPSLSDLFRDDSGDSEDDIFASLKVQSRKMINSDIQKAEKENKNLFAGDDDESPFSNFDKEKASVTTTKPVKVKVNLFADDSSSSGDEEGDGAVGLFKQSLASSLDRKEPQEGNVPQEERKTVEKQEIVVSAEKKAGGGGGLFDSLSEDDDLFSTSAKAKGIGQHTQVAIEETKTEVKACLPTTKADKAFEQAAPEEDLKRGQVDSVGEDDADGNAASRGKRKSPLRPSPEAPKKDMSSGDAESGPETAGDKVVDLTSPIAVGARSKERKTVSPAEKEQPVKMRPEIIPPKLHVVQFGSAFRNSLAHTLAKGPLSPQSPKSSTSSPVREDPPERPASSPVQASFGAGEEGSGGCLLVGANKGRVKVGAAKRRPPTRQGRRAAALRPTGMEDDDDFSANSRAVSLPQNISISSQESSRSISLPPCSTIITSQTADVNTSGLSVPDSTYSDRGSSPDPMMVPPPIPSTDSSLKSESTVSPSPWVFLRGSSHEENSATKDEASAAAKKNKTALFDSSDNDDDLFARPKAKDKARENEKKASLFDDSSDSDDLFSKRKS